MTYAVALDLLLKYGPTAVAMAQKLAANIAAGKANESVTDADWTELERLSALSSDSIYARLGINKP